MKNLKWQAALYNLCILFNCLLIFLLLFSSRILVPSFLQVFGRVHPMILHFPIVLLLLAFVLELTIIYSKQPAALKGIADWVLLAASLTTAVAALSGLFLSREPGYSGDEVSTHKWLGVTCSFVSFLWYGSKDLIRKNKAAMISTGLGTSVLLFIAGHKGAGLTHGNDFLLAPIKGDSKEPTVLLEDAVVYTHLVKPIIEQKCMGCHNSSKAKGELIMETEQLLLKGGKNGKPWDTAAADFGLMMRRIHLPLEDKEHMPPKSKPQLTDEEISILYLWIKGGAGFDKKILDLPEKDSLRMIATVRFKSNDADVYDFPATDRNIIAKLNNDYRVVTPLATGSPAISVNFYGASRFTSDQLKELEQIKNNIVSLQISKMPVTDEDLKIIGSFSNLRALNLSFTAIKGEGINYLTSLQQLKHLSLSGTAVSSNNLRSLAQLKKLQSIQVWNTSITPQDIASLKTDFSKTIFDSGFKGDTVLAKLAMPVIEAEKKAFKTDIPVTIKNPIKSAVIRYTIDGSEPDSLASPIYKEPFTVNKTGIIKARSFLPGWISSNTAAEYFYKSSVMADSIQMTPPEKKFAVKNNNVLIDGELGLLDFSSGDNWAAYREAPLEANLFFKQPVEISNITLRSLIDINAYIMPPSEIQVWGGDNNTSLHLLKKLMPQQPARSETPYIASYECSFATRKIQVVKLIVKPVGKLPAWHPGKGDKGWVFLDELFMN
ncbi:MAG TPA: DUF2231 domain-containing protein [Chitinophagaceae bacterium]|nr:DUF2231 domain-containing protein [Chitinophagaceae bacterium]